MYIANIDYSSLYNAQRSMNSANQGKYAAQYFNSQQKGFTLKQDALDLQGERLTLQKDYLVEQRKTQNVQLALQAVSVLTEAGKAVFGMYQEAQTQKAKIQMINEAQPAIAKRRMEAVANGEIEVVTDEFGEQSIQMSPEYDQDIQNIISGVTENYKLDSVQQYIEGALGQYSVEQKISAMDGIARQQMANVEVSDKQMMDSAVQESIATGNTKKIDSALSAMSGRRSSTDIGVRKEAAMLQYEDGIRKKEISTVLNTDGLVAAEDHIRGLGLTPDKEDAYISFARLSAEADSQSAVMKAQQIAEEVQRNGGTYRDAASAVAADNSIAPAFREKLVRSYEMAHDTEQMKELTHTSGKQAALDYANSPDRKYTIAEKEQQIANADIIEANELLKIKNETTQIAQKVVEEGGSFPAVYKAIEEGQSDPAHKEAAMSAAEAVHAQQLNNMFENRYRDERYDLKMLQQHRDEIQKSSKTAGPYTRQGELANNHLDRLDREIASFGTPGDIDYNAYANEYFNRKYIALNAGAITVKEVLAEISDPSNEELFNTLMKSTKVTPFFKDMVDFNITEGPMAPIAKGILDDYELMLKAAKDVDPTELNSLRAGLGVQINNYLDGNQNVTESDLRKIATDYNNQTRGKIFDVISATYDGNPGTMQNEKQVWELQKALDTENMNYTVDIQGNTDIPPAIQAQMQQHMEVMRTKLSVMLTGTPGAAFHSGYASLGDPTKVNPGFVPTDDGKVSANPVYVVTTNGVPRKYIMAAGAKKGEYDVYEITKSGLSKVTVLDKDAGDNVGGAGAAGAATATSYYDVRTRSLRNTPEDAGTTGFENLDPDAAARLEELRKKYPGRF